MESPTLNEFTKLLVSLSDEKEIASLTKIQKNTLRRYEEMNGILGNFNDLSELTFKTLHGNFSRHTKTLLTMQNDLDVVFRRIRLLKAKLAEKYPDAFEATSDAIKELKERYCVETEFLEKASCNVGDSNTSEGVYFPNQPGPERYTENSATRSTDACLIRADITSESPAIEQAFEDLPKAENDLNVSTVPLDLPRPFKSHYSDSLIDSEHYTGSSN